MELYVGSDLHSSNTMIAIMDKEGNRLKNKRIKNHKAMILDYLQPYKSEIAGIVVESTYNYYWYADMLAEEGYPISLANPCAMQKYRGVKCEDDKHDAYWLADMLRLGILPEGYIYPKKERPLRDLLRKRGHLVRIKTSLKMNASWMTACNSGIKFKCKELDISNLENIKKALPVSDDLLLALTSDLELIDNIEEQIHRIECRVEKKLKLRKPYINLQTIPGIGKILAMTIMLETGPIERFEKAGNYASYCRLVPAERSSNNKRKGRGNRKNGNKYLACAYSQAAVHARNNYECVRNYYNRKLAKTKTMIAQNALAHKLARAAYHMMKDDIAFDYDRCFK